MDLVKARQDKSYDYEGTSKEKSARGQSSDACGEVRGRQTRPVHIVSSS